MPFFMVFMVFYIDLCAFRVFRKMFLNSIVYLASLDVNFSVKWLKKCKFVNFNMFCQMGGQNTTFNVFLLFFNNFCVFRDSRENTLALNTLFDFKWRRFKYKMIGKVELCKFWHVLIHSDRNTIYWWFLLRFILIYVFRVTRKINF